MRLGQIKASTWAAQNAANQITCQAAGNVWFSDTTDPTGTGSGSCVPASEVANKNFDPSKLFSNFTLCIGGPCGGGSGAAAPSSAPAKATPAPPPSSPSIMAATRHYSAPLPVSSILGPAPDITAAFPPAISEEPPEPCAGLAGWVDQNKPAAVLALLGAFVLLGGLK